MPIVALTDPDGALGRCLHTLVGDQVAVNGDEPVELRPVHGTDPDDLVHAFTGVDAVAHLATGTPASPTGPTTDVPLAQRVFDAAAKAEVGHLVLLSDATVYGAWANNPVPLTDDALVRPNPGFIYAAERAELERLAGEWRTDHPGSTVTVLRPVRTPGRADWLLAALQPGRAVPDEADEPPAQFLDLGDLASAIVLACRKRLDGVYNVAPEGSIDGDELRSLTGSVARVRLPARLVHRLTSWRFRSGLGPTPPELVPYTLHPWVVASDRLRVAGWQPRLTNQEVCVGSHSGGRLDEMSPRKRQELALGVAGAGLVVAVVGAGVLVRRLLRKR